MLSYLVNFIHAFIPVSLVTGLLLALWSPLYGRSAFRPVVIDLAAGLLAGMIVYFVSLHQEIATSVRVFLYGAAIFAALGNGATTLVLSGKGGSLLRLAAILFFTAALAGVAVFSFLGHVAEQALSATRVLNTELILNIAGILAGASLIAFLIPLIAHLGAKSGRRIISGVLLFVSLLFSVQWSAEILLGLMRLEMVELTSLRLSFVARVAKYSYGFPYVQALLIAALAIAFFARRPAVEPRELVAIEKAERRKAQSRAMFEMRWFKAALVSVFLMFAVFLYYDIYASRPPKISPPLHLTPDGAGLIKIAIDEVRDGNLHRYAYVTEDGHVVRFFLINRSKGRIRMGVVLDACMLCGDMGYLQHKNEIICIACNVRIFIPSIGKEGGCNPIPLKHKIEGGHVLIRAEDLDAGARYFSQVVSKKVKDPVTDRDLDSNKAPYRYEYEGRTYFFESEESGEKFKKSPETYVAKQQTSIIGSRDAGNHGKGGCP